MLKVLWEWEVKNKISLKAVKVSASAKEKIEKAWWKVEILSK
jgi:ribosomal protein L15